MGVQPNALKLLGEADRRRALDVARALRSVWVAADHFTAVAQQLVKLIPGCAVGVYDRSPEGDLGRVAHTFSGRLSTSWLHGSATFHTRTSPHYSLTGRDPLTNRPVDTTTLYRGEPEPLELFREQTLRPFGLWYQLRTVIYDGSRFLAFCGVFRGKDRGEFGRREKALLATVVAPLADGFATVRAVGSTPVDIGELGRILDAFDESAYLVDDRGRVVFENLAATSERPERPPWVSSFVRDGRDHDAHVFARSTSLEVEGRRFWLVVPRDRATRRARAESLFHELPGRLRAAAELALRGLSEKQIADEMSLSQATVRTYVQRIYRRLGVRSRAELLTLAALTRRPVSTPSR